MKVFFDSEVDVLRILFSSQAIEESDEDERGLIIDYDKEGNIIGIEVLEASKRIENPRTLEYAVAGKTPQCEIEGQSDSLKYGGPI